MRVWLLSTDQGDGSRGIQFFDNKESCNRLIEHDPDTYSDGDGGNIYSFEVPDGTEITGINIRTVEDVNEMIDEEATVD